VDTADTRKDATPTDLPWDQLGSSETIPWDAIHSLADALVTNAGGDVVARTIAQYEQFGEDEDDFARLHLIGVVAAAGPRLTGEQRGQLAEWAVRKLNDAAESDLDFDCENWMRLAAPLLPQSVHAAVPAIEAETDGGGGWFYLWSFIDAASLTSDDSTRQAAVALARKTLEDAIAGEAQPDDALPAVEALGFLGDRDSLPRVNQLIDAFEDADVEPGLAREYEGARAVIAGEVEPSLDAHHTEPVDVWMPRRTEFLQRWYEDFWRDVQGLERDDPVDLNEPLPFDDADAPVLLPWQALQRTDAIPWAAINEAADLLVADREASLVAEVEPRYERLRLAAYEDNQSGEFGMLHTIAAVATAGPRMTSEQRKAWADFTMAGLAWDASDDADIWCERWLHLAVPLLPESIDAAMEVLQEDEDPLGPWFYAWDFVEKACRTDDEAVRQRAADFAIAMLQRGIDGQIDLGVASRAAMVLARLKDQAYLEPIDRALAAAKRLDKRTFLSPVAELQYARDVLTGNEVPYGAEDETQPVEAWLEPTWNRLRDWYDRPPEPEDVFDYDPQPARMPVVTDIDTIRREEPKVGRNDPCPCCSGKKYKKCCGR
jgi:hypothetical protein